MKLQTLEGLPLTREEFKHYLLQCMNEAAKNKDFNYPHFLFDLRNKCDMSLEELMGFINEINLVHIEKNGLKL